MTRSKRAGALVLGAVLLARGPAPLRAQEFEPFPLPSGVLRIGVASDLVASDRRFGRRNEGGSLVEEVEPLGYDLGRQLGGASLLPALSAAEAALRAILDDPAYRFRLGVGEVSVDQILRIVPWTAEFGLTDRVTLFGRLPLVKGRSEVDVLFRPDSVNVGPNPALDDPEATAAYLAALSGAVAAGEARVQDLCTALGEDAPQCRDGRDLVAEARAVLAGLGAALPSAPLLPLAGSPAGAALDSLLQALGEGLAALGVSPLPGSPPLATTPVDTALLAALVTDPLYGIGGAPLALWEGGWELGDVEVGALVRLLGPVPGTEPSDSARVRVRGAGRLRIRLGTGRPDDPANFVDLPTGDGQTDVEVGGLLNLQVGRRLDAWVDVRYGVQLAGAVSRRVAPPELPLAPAGRLRRLRWTPGNYLEVRIFPRLVVAPGVTAGVSYAYRRKGTDRFEYAPGETPATGPDGAPLPADLLARETASNRQRLGIGLSYSTLPGAGDGRSRLPVELSALFESTVAGGGGRTWKAGRFLISARAPVRLRGR